MIDNMEAILERAAIAEFDGSLTRADAERLAACEFAPGLPPLAQRLLVHALELATVTAPARFWAYWHAIEDSMSWLGIEGVDRMTIWRAYDAAFEEVNQP